MKSNAQSSLEFIILVGFVMVAFAVFFISIQENMATRINERVNLRIQEIGQQVKTEIALATQAQDGYQRNFTLPTNAHGVDYEVDLIEDIISVWTTDNRHAISYSVDHVFIGTVVKGENTIIKENGRVKINP